MLRGGPTSQCLVTVCWQTWQEQNMLMSNSKISTSICKIFISGCAEVTEFVANTIMGPDTGSVTRMNLQSKSGYKVPCFTAYQSDRNYTAVKFKDFRKDETGTQQPCSITLFRFVLLSSDIDLRDLLPREDDLFFTREFLSNDFDLLLFLRSRDLDRRLSLSFVSCCLLDLLLSPDFDCRCRRRSSDFDLLLLFAASTCSDDPRLLRTDSTGSVWSQQKLLAGWLAQAGVKNATVTNLTGCWF